MQKTYTCKYCGQQFKNRVIGGHTTYCRKNPNNKRIKRYETIISNCPEATKQNLIELYVNQEKSIPQLVVQLKITYSQVCFMLDWYGIKQRTLKEAVNTQEIRKKTKSTNKARYGYEQLFSKNAICYNKTRQKLFDKYGVTNIFATDWFKDKLREGQFTDGIPFKQWMRQKNKEYWNALSCQQQQNWCKKIHSGRGKTTSIELLVMKALTELNIDFQHQYYLHEYGKVKYAYDFRLIDTNILLEINGDYWHANPCKYKAEDLIPYPRNRLILAKDIWDKDSKKTEFAILQGYKVITIWQKDINANKDNINDYIINKIIEVYNESTKNSRY